MDVLDLALTTCLGSLLSSNLVQDDNHQITKLFIDTDVTKAKHDQKFRVLR